MTDQPMAAPAASQTKTKYDGVAKTIHWIVALFMLVMLTFGWTLEDLPEGEHEATLVIHSSLGISVLILMLVRLYWRTGHPPPPLPADMPRWQTVAANASHHSLYAFAILQPILGIGQALFADFDVSPFGLGPLSIGANETLFGIFHALHGLNAILLIAIISIHVSAALYHHFVRRDTVLKRMLPYGRA